MKTKRLLAGICLVLLTCHANSQCLTPPSFPDCTGSETLVADNEVISSSTIRWHYGISATRSNVRLSGGTLIVCNDLTVNDLVMDSGTIVVKAGAKLIVTNGAGLVLRGDCSIYNWGTFQCLGNIVMDYGVTSALRPNVIINATPSSVWLMPNQYFVINNPWSWFVNMGSAEFHGIITDPGASTGSVCLGDGSRVSMMVLYNRAKLPYTVPNGFACVSVSQYSQFYDTLTANPTLNICLGPSHISETGCIPWGCKPNSWGAAQVMNNCTTCVGALTTLPVHFTNIKVQPSGHSNELSWMIENIPGDCMFFIQCGPDGKNFVTVDSIRAAGKLQYSYKHRTQKTAYYRIQAYLPEEGKTLHSRVVSATIPSASLLVYPNPFTKNLFLNLPSSTVPYQVTITDITGSILCKQVLMANATTNAINTGELAKGSYILRIQQGDKVQSFIIQKQ